MVIYFRTEAQAKKATKPLIAKKDIIVFKMLHKAFDDKYISPLKGFLEWQKGDHMYQKATKNDPAFTLSGPHQSVSTRKWYIRVSVGLHSAATIYQARKVASGTAFQMIIPKGSKYYTNGKVYVSDNLIFPYGKA